MFIFEIFYKSLESRPLLNFIRIIEHTTRALHIITPVVLLIAILEKCWLLLVSSCFVLFIIFFTASSSTFTIISKFLLMISFASIVPDIKRVDFLLKGYNSSLVVVAKNKNKSLKIFFEKV